MKKKTMLHIIKYISILNNNVLKTESVMSDKLEQAIKSDTLNSVSYTIFRQITTLGINTNVMEALLNVLENSSKKNLNEVIYCLHLYINSSLLQFKDDKNKEICILITYTQEVKDLLQIELDNLKGV